MVDYIRAQGSQIHSIFATLTDANGNLDLPYDTVVTFVGVPFYQPQPTSPGQTVTPIPQIGGSAVVLRPGATPDDPYRGVVRYDLSSGDVAQPGMYRPLWFVTPPGQATAQAFPEDATQTLWIMGTGLT